ncbi:phage tail terminator family protein [Konateibacter massiliensis]|uniref:phage tail terminator family protein n=1 Tax=Konateibacter massiliensis TaxID=2002841 RepID=UPI000C15E0AA|nr:hypothetical protein [Konateibacter massiliensis]
MLNKTIEGISKALLGAFGEEYTVYTNEEEDKTLPCLMVVPLTSSQEQKSDSRYERLQSFEIRYFPKEANDTRECMEAAEKLYDALEYIAVGDNLIRGSGMNTELEDKVLHFKVDFNMLLFKQTERINMDNMQSAVGVKEDD